jgi:hypothetical protein
MKLDSFRDLLVKKSQDTSLQNLVKFMRDEVLADLVVESLEKMARASHKGDAANFAIRDFGTEMDPAHEPGMIHDALSHHVSNYKAALGSGNQNLANQHAKQAFRIIDMADQAQKHSHGKLQVEAVSPHAWERNSKSETFGDKMKRLQGAKENGQPISQKEEAWLSDNPVTRGFKKPNQHITDTKGWRNRDNDLSFLQQAPHNSYAKEIRRHGHDNAYPFENIKINGKHVDVEDKPSNNYYKSHPFDSHPIMNHFEESAGSRTPDRDKQYMEQRDQFADSPELNDYFNSQEKRKAADPKAFEHRGSTKSLPVHKQVEPLSVSKEVPDSESAAPAQATQAAPAQAAQKTIRRPKEQAEQAKLSPEDRQAMLDRLTPELRAKFERMYQNEGE